MIGKRTLQVSTQVGSRQPHLTEPLVPCAKAGARLGLRLPSFLSPGERKMLASILALALTMFAMDPAWQSNINKVGWVEVRATADVVFLLKRSSAPSSFWFRAEMEDRSEMFLMRYDCSNWTLQIAQQFSYSQPNMTGETTASSTVSAADVPPPNSVLDGLLTAACPA
jgi:hypothetical protein